MSNETEQGATASAGDNVSVNNVHNEGNQDQHDQMRSNLIINYIPSNMTQDDLERLFAPFGTIESCKLIRDKLTGQSLGYGFIKYSSNHEAGKAIERMNGQQIGNKILKVAVARPSSFDIKHANLYVSGLPSTYKTDDLEKLFTPYGQICEAKVLVDHNGNSRCSGFVRFEYRGHAETAMQCLNGIALPGSTQNLFVKFADTPSSSARKQQYGAMRRNQAVSTNRFNPMQSTMNPFMMGAASMPAMPPPPTQPIQPQQSAGVCLFVYHLPQDADESLLYQLFAPFGAILSVKIMRDFSTGKCKGFGFVNMLHYQDANQAILALNGFKVGNKFLQVSFKQDKTRM